MRWLGEAWSGLTDLVLPNPCAGCGAPADHRSATAQLCVRCHGELAALRPHPVSPTPSPPGFPPCVGLGPYDGVLRELLLAYKERGAHHLAQPLGALLAGTVATGLARRPASGAVAMIPVPDTARAARQRFGDHMLRLADAAARSLRHDGIAARAVTALVARPHTDSTQLSSAARIEHAANAFAHRPAALRRVADGATVVVLDDIVTTGATLSAASQVLHGAGVPVSMAVVLAATQRHNAPARNEQPPTGVDTQRNPISAQDLTMEA
jgi:predicted amidophosphoribosyltransferase